MQSDSRLLYKVWFEDSEGCYAEYFEADNKSEARELAELYQKDEAGLWATGMKITSIERVD